MYSKAKLKAKNVSRRAKNEEWMELGTEMEEDASESVKIPV